MRKEELIELVKELEGLESLKGREDDIRFLKREYQRLLNKEEETYYEKCLTIEFMMHFDALAVKVPELNKSSLEDKKDILKKARELVDSKSDIKNLNKKINDLFNEFKRLPKLSKEVDDELFNEFKQIKEDSSAAVNEYYNGIKEAISDRKAKKEEIILKAKELVNAKNMKDATASMDKLMEEWKAVGFAGKEYDEDLWTRFSEVKKEFNQKKKEYYEHMKVVIEERAVKKAELIKKVKYITSEAYFTDEEVKQIKDIEKEFRNLGFAGKEKDQELWDEMQAAIRKYFDEMKFYK